MEFKNSKRKSWAEMQMVQGLAFRSSISKMSKEDQSLKRTLTFDQIIIMNIIFIYWFTVIKKKSTLLK